MWIVKLGGSWVSNPELQELIDKLYNYRNEPIVLVVGGENLLMQLGLLTKK